MSSAAAIAAQPPRRLPREGAACRDAFDFGDSTQGLLAKLTQIQRDTPRAGADQHTLTVLLEQTRTEVIASPGLGSGREGRPRPSGHVQVGDVINERFVLEEQIGRGGMGRVFKALDRRRMEARSCTPYVAVKVMSAPGLDVEAATVAMSREVQRSQALTHPNIVRVNDFDRDGATVFATMELLEGTPLRAHIDRAGPRGISGAHARRIIRQSAHALAHAHRHGILHADFKPSNVFITKEGDVKVIDFGIARAYGPAAGPVYQRLSDAQAMSGITPTYASPEMLAQQAPDPRDDVYALGCVAYEVLTGRHPFDRLPASRARDLGRRPAKPERVSRREWAALKGALRFDRAARTATAQAFLAAFGERDSRPATRSPRAALVSTAALLGSLLWLPSMPASGDVSAAERSQIVELGARAVAAGPDLGEASADLDRALAFP